MKKIILLLILILNSSFCLAAEKLDIQLGQDYLITFNKSVKNLYVSHPDVLLVSPFFTILNEKNVFLIHPKAQGKTNIMTVWGEMAKTYEATVKAKSNQKPQIIEKELFDILPLDAPPKNKKFEKKLENLEIDPPPPLKLEAD